MTLVGADYRAILNATYTTMTASTTTAVEKLQLANQLRGQCYEALKQSGRFEEFVERLNYCNAQNYLNLSALDTANIIALVSKAGIVRGLQLWQNGAMPSIGPGRGRGRPRGRGRGSFRGRGSN
ncbi:hypothetical protein GNI_221950 [Gregarina niphandrodes]|uniref:Uncharacterized protein n=1 Tax=Gregarina niphandrodes TaxID=110365 RepID=A0A023AW23_GRENI|nr:hypothetical protein GNI_221950 [Gregarina niphandrodes]EZG42812.1 hypothetical protein GNI_221950 [Gregarina niphandrodes]|eukprot:XP_011133909.1 hypothetical protein GNI_221950 [Gregarina niphandrodes]